MTTITARERLINAAVEAFAEKGFAATTTRDIASRAGMSPAAVYVHHDSKESLLFSVSLNGHRKALEVITSAAASLPSIATSRSFSHLAHETCSPGKPSLLSHAPSSSRRAHLPVRIKTMSPGPTLIPARFSHAVRSSG